MEEIKAIKYFVTNLKSNFQNFFLNSTRVRPMFLNYDEFFVCERVLKFLSFTFMPNYLGIDLKRQRYHFIASCVGMMIIFLIATVSFVISGRAVLNNDKNYIFLMLENMAYSGVLFVISVKIFVLFFLHRDRIVEVIRRLEQHFTQSSLDQSTRNTGKYLKFIKNFNVMLNGIYLETHIQYCFMPFIHKFYGWLHSSNVSWELIISLILPFDHQNFFIYWSLNLFMSWEILFALLASKSTDMLFACITNVLAMEFDNLAQIIGDIDWDDDDDGESEEETIKELKVLVNVHDELCDIAAELRKIFSFLLLINAFGIIFCICICAFLSISGISNYFLIKYSAPFVAMTVQIFLHCYFGERLSESSAAVAESVYNNAWYKASPRFRKMALMIMMRAQREQKIRAWKFVDINLKTFYWIITTAYSYYSFLSGVYEP